VFPDQLPEEFRKSLADSFPGSGEAYIPIDPENWEIITDGMAQVTEPGEFHTAGSAHLEGIDFAGKTGTAQQMSHEALGKTNKGKSTNPNVWFVGVTPRRNPELVVAVLWQNGEFSYYPARIGAQIVEAYVDKKRRLAGNLPPPKAAPPVEVGAVWSTPDVETGTGAHPGARKSVVAGTRGQIHSGHFFIENGQIVAANPATAQTGHKSAKSGTSPAAVNVQATPMEVAAALPERRPGLKTVVGPAPGPQPEPQPRRDP
jgi:penicillin-binding protein 2